MLVAGLVIFSISLVSILGNRKRRTARIVLAQLREPGEERSAVSKSDGVEIKRSGKEDDELIFHLPIVMEKLVMAVQAGYDILPAIGLLRDLEQIDAQPRQDPSSIDPVSRLLEKIYDLSEAGMTFQQSLDVIVQRVKNPSIRHVFAHLALAFNEGGELTTPLLELSDATQLAFQEAVEERIAVLPVKAVMPLLLTFAGLLLGFITSPLIQLLHLTAKGVAP